MFTTSAYAQNATPDATGSSTNGMLVQLFPIALILFVFYMIVFRPMEKQKKKQETLLSTLKKGDEVVTTGGLIGKISKLDTNEILIEVADGVKLRVLRATVSGLYNVELPDKTR